MASMTSVSAFMNMEIMSSRMPTFMDRGTFSRPLELVNMSILPKCYSPPFSRVVALILTRIRESGSSTT